AEGDIAAGEALPSEPSLVRQYGVSRTTVRRALARLAAERCIVRRRGSGTFARDSVTKSASARQIAAILDDPRSASNNTTVRVLELKQTPVPDFLHREWPEFGATVMTIRKVQYVEHQPVALVTAYVPEEVGRQLTARRLGNDTVLTALDKLGFHGAVVEEEASAVAADPVTGSAATALASSSTTAPWKPSLSSAVSTVSLPRRRAVSCRPTSSGTYAVTSATGWCSTYCTLRMVITVAPNSGHSRWRKSGTGVCLSSSTRTVVLLDAL